MLARLRLDPFLMILLAVLAVATLLPVRGGAAIAADQLTDVAIALLFFLHGAKLSREAILAGIGAWRLHLLVLSATYALFPLFGLAIAGALGGYGEPLGVMGVEAGC